MPALASRSLVVAVILAAAGSHAPAAQRPAAGGEVVAVRELQLKAGVDAAQFEQFVRATYNPGWATAVAGLRGYIAKGDRGAQKGTYALFLVFDSQQTRDAIFPKEGGGAAAAFTAKLQAPTALNQQLEKYLEPGSLSVYTDYVVLR
jgi:hypothetical protein